MTRLSSVPMTRASRPRLRESDRSTIATTQPVVASSLIEASTGRPATTSSVTGDGRGGHHPLHFPYHEAEATASIARDAWHARGEQS